MEIIYLNNFISKFFKLKVSNLHLLLIEHLYLLFIHFLIHFLYLSIYVLVKFILLYFYIC